MSPAAQSPAAGAEGALSTDDFVGYVYFSWGFAAVFEYTFDSGGTFYYVQEYDYYISGYGYWAYGYNEWWLDFSLNWTYLGWYCCHG